MTVLEAHPVADELGVPISASPTGVLTTTTTTRQTAGSDTESGHSVNPVLRPLYVGIVNDFPVVTAGVATILQPHRHRVRVEEFAGNLPPRGRVDVVLYDPFSRSDALERLRTIRRVTGAKVLLYTWVATQAQVDDAMRAGAVGILPKTVDGATMVSAIEAAARGASLTARPMPDSSVMAAWPGKDQGLTAREAEIVSLIVAGVSNQEIAEATYLSINSIKTYIRTAYRKMGVVSRPQAILWGIRHGLQAQDTPIGLRDGSPE